MKRYVIAIIVVVAAAILFHIYSTHVHRQPQLTARMSIAAQNKQEGTIFLAKNAEMPGVISLPSGLQYKILQAGTGPKPSLDSTVTVDYEGRYIDGTVFDSSYKRGKPISFPLGGVISGWRQALPMMKQGATWVVYIPSELAYGVHGSPPVIGPNQTLIFKIHLIAINKAAS